uniref:Uncharacterized protein n=1 Tax=Sander lucioperca TaxID=283035 RepID=A0A8C9ZFC4_SANLU
KPATSKSQQKPSPSAAAQKGAATAKLKGSKTQSINGSTTQAPKGTVSVSITRSAPVIKNVLVFPAVTFVFVFFFLKGGNVESNFSTVDVLRKRLHEKIEESRGQVCSI